jgi:PAS domain S-box-containing protein
MRRFHREVVEEGHMRHRAMPRLREGPCEVSAAVLIVEDEGVVAKDIETCLQRLGYEVAGWATSGDEAVEKADRERPDVILMDIRLRGEMDGIHAAEAIRRDHDIPVVYLTAYADDVTLRRAMVTEPFGYVVKPFSERELHTAIEIALYKHRTELEHRRREEWLETTLGSIGDAIIAADREGMVTFLNPAAEAMTGWPRHEAMGRPLADVFEVIGQVGEAVALPISEVVSTGRAASVSEEATLVSRDGRRTPVADTTVPVVVAPIADQGDVFGAVLVFRDISDKRKAENAMRRLLEQLESSNRELDDQRSFMTALFHYVPSAVMVVNPSLRIHMVNRIFAESFGLDGNTLKGLDLGLANVLGCPHRNEASGACGTVDECTNCFLVRLIRGALEGTPSVRTRCRLERDNGHRRELTLLVSAAPLEHGREQLAIVTLEDVTELNGLRRLMEVERSFAGMVGGHPSMVEIYQTIRDVAEADVPVMILGESGTGKELVARAVHSEGPRASKNFVAVNCGALPDGLLESELFGHVKGAFTGAVRDRKGRFELANGGTIFLDEIGDLSPSLQVKLLRVLQEGTFERVGSEKTISADVRVVCATNKDLAREVKEGRFRDDLYYRLCVLPIEMPPLRDRISDLPMIAQHLLERYSVVAERSCPELAPEVVEQFMTHDWPGNVRELQNVLQYALVTCRGDLIETGHLPPTYRKPESGVRTAPPETSRKASTTLEPESVIEALRAADGNRTRAAKLLGVSRATLYRFFDDHPEVADSY